MHALHLQDKTPSWYDAYPMVMVSEYKSWKEVSDWAAALFPQAVAISAGLKKKIEELRAASPTDEGQVLAAIRFVQDDVRYMGIEMGVNSHLPNNPNKIFEQRFGDCKDKSYLLCTILRSLGFEADPVLINSVYKKTIFNWQPSCYAFDHCTVRMKVNERYHFIDPTISYQRDGINDISFPDYQCGLIVTDTATALSIIPLQEKGMVKVKELITIPDMLGKATLVATTEYTGSYADVMRDEFKNNSIYEMQKDFLNFYANYFTETTVADSLKIKDDENTGKFTTTEYYNIDKIWELKDGVKKVSLYAFMINSIIQKPKDLSRTMPVRLTYPAHYNEEVEIDLPEKWKVEDSHDKISCAAFTLDADFTYSNKKIFLKYDYQALKDNAAPAEAKEFLNGIKKFDDELGFGVTYKEAGTIADDDYSNASSPTRSNIAYTILSVIAIVVAVVVRTQRRR